MNTDDIIKLAREAAAKHGQELDESPEPEIVAFLVEFHTLATQAEREQCAQAAGPEDSYQDEWFKAKADSVLRIRARNHVVDANKMPSQPDCTDCDCADNDPCKRTAPGLVLESGEFVPASEIAYHPV